MSEILIAAHSKVTYPSSITKPSTASLQDVADSVSASHHDNGMVKDFLFKLLKHKNGDQLEEYTELLSKYGLNTSVDNSDISERLNELKGLITDNDGAPTMEDLANYITTQQQKQKKLHQLLSTIRQSIKTVCLKQHHLVSKLIAEMKREAEKPVSDAQESLEDKSSADDSFYIVWQSIAFDIGSIKKNYLDPINDRLMKVTDLLKKYNSIVLAASAQAVTAGKDANTVKFDVKIMAAALIDFGDIAKNADFGSIDNWNSMTDEEKSTARNTYAPALTIDDNGVMTFDRTEFNKLSSGPEGVNSDGEVSVASYQAWLAQINAFTNSLESGLQTLAQHANQANNSYDNLIKTLSGSIPTITELLMMILKAIRG